MSADGALLAVGSHDNFIYLYTVSESGRKYSRYGKCTVSPSLEVTGGGLSPAAVCSWSCCRLPEITGAPKTTW